MDSYDNLTRDEQLQRGRWASTAMRNLGSFQRDELIAGCDNCVDGRAKFEAARKAAHLARGYRGYTGPDVA